MIQHQPLRPGWTCRRCGLPYVCPVGRVELVLAYAHTTALGRHASMLLEQAAQDQPELEPAELWGRFIAWTKPSELPDLVRLTRAWDWK